MNRTFYTMKQNVGKRIGDSTTDMLNLIGGYINDRAIEVYRRFNILANLRSDYQLTTTAGAEDCVLPKNFGKEISVVDKTNGRPLTRIDSQINAEKNYAVLDTQGTVCSYIIIEKTVRTQPTAASVISFVSSSASDTSQSVYVKGLDANGYEAYEIETLTGTTPVSTTTQFSRVLLISKSAATVGTVTATSNTGGVTVAVFSPAEITHRVKVMRFVQVPNSAITVEINFIEKLLPMSQNYDYPILECEDVLEAGAEADAWRFKRQFAKAADLDIVFEKRLANLVYDKESQPNKVQLFNPRTYRNQDAYGANVDDSRRYGVF